MLRISNHTEVSILRKVIKRSACSKFRFFLLAHSEKKIFVDTVACANSCRYENNLQFIRLRMIGRSHSFLAHLPAPLGGWVGGGAGEVIAYI